VNDEHRPLRLVWSAPRPWWAPRLDPADVDHWRNVVRQLGRLWRWALSIGDADGAASVRARWKRRRLWLRERGVFA
jgi:hypothetical protein